MKNYAKFESSIDLIAYLEKKSPMSVHTSYLSHIEKGIPIAADKVIVTKNQYFVLLVNLLFDGFIEIEIEQCREFIFTK